MLLDLENIVIFCAYHLSYSCTHSICMYLTHIIAQFPFRDTIQLLTIHYYCILCEFMCIVYPSTIPTTGGYTTQLVSNQIKNCMYFY